MPTTPFLPLNWPLVVSKLKEKNLQPCFLYKPKGANKVSESTFTRMKRTGSISLRNIKRLALLLDVSAEELLFVPQNQPRAPRRITVVFMENLEFRHRLSLAWKILSKGFKKMPSIQ